MELSFMVLICLVSLPLFSSQSCTWHKNAGKNSRGGIHQTFLNTIDTCRANCISKKDTECQYGFDWNQEASIGYKCWFGKAGPLYDLPGVDHYDLVCGPKYAWIKTANSNSPGGNIQSSETSLQMCQDKCLQMKESTCKYGLDYNNNAGLNAQSRCYFAISSNLKVNGYPGVDHYMYQLTAPVVGGGTASPYGCTLDKKADKNTRGGTAQTSVTTFDTCKANCISKKDTECQYGFDWNQAATPGYKCWFGKAGPLYDFPGVDHYDLVCGH